MAEPTLTDYVQIMFTLFDMFAQQQENNQPKRGHPFAFSEKAMIVLYTLFQYRRL